MRTYALPPLLDHHSHYSLYAALSSMPSLAEVYDHAHACEVIRSSINETLTVIQGWNSAGYTLAPGDIEEGKPVIVLDLSLHGMIMNHCAEEYLSRDYMDIVQNYKNLRWTEKNLPGILNMIVRLASLSAEKTRSFGRSLMETGIGAMEDMLLPDSGWLALMPDFPIPVEYWADERVFAALGPLERGKVKGVKLFTDGALGTRTAALSAPYVSGGRGILLMDSDVITSELHNYMKQGIPVAVHAIGDMAVDQVVKTAGILRRERGCSGPVRIEHAQFITRDAAFAARDEGITLSMQPNFSLDSVMYTDRLPRGYAAVNNPFRMLIDDAGFIPGRDLFFGSDGMPHGMQPALQSALFPPFAGQALTIMEFKEGYCLPGADNEWLVRIDDNSVEISRL